MTIKVNRHKSFLLVLVFLLFTKPSESQEKRPAVTIPSANSINLGMYGEVPVSLYSGLPEINIPIYTLQAKTIVVPISLNYHASGIRPEVHPSWVGLGWSLNAGGSITRLVKGYADESKNDRNSYNPIGYYTAHAGNTRSDWPDVCQTTTCDNSFSGFISGYRGNDLLKDYSPDEFMFNFPGHSGKFFMDDAGQWQVQCDKPVKVEFDGQFIAPFAMGLSYLPGYYDNGSNPFKTFTITDETGIKYVFGESASCIEYSDVLVQGDPEYSVNGYNFLATSWQLKRIVSADGKDVVDFNYERGPFQCDLYSSLSKMNMSGSSGGAYNPGCYSSSTSFSYGGKIMSPVYLKSVEYQKQHVKIDFSTSASGDLSYSHSDYEDVVNNLLGVTSYDDQNLSPILDYYMPSQIPFFTDPYNVPAERRDRFIWLKLDKISISDAATTTKLKSIVFNYNNSSSERLKLGSVDLKGANAVVAQTYGFAYNTSQSLPNYLRSRCDHWGFNNGSSAITNASPSTFTNFYSSKDPNINYAKAGILEQITYPTGGKTTLEYELNHYEKVVNSQDRTVLDNASGDAGGLRIKKITSFDNAGHQQAKEYFYVTGYNAVATPSSLPSSGILDALPKYDFSNINGVDENGTGFTYSIFSSNPVVPLTLTSTGQHIGYAEVVEKRSDGAYTIYKFTSNSNGYNDLNAVKTINRGFVPYLPNSSRDFERGQLLFKAQYDNNDKLVQSEEYEFTRLATNGVRSIQQDYKGICTPTPRGYVSRAAYYLYYYPFVVSKKTTVTNKTGTGNAYMTTVENFTYQNKLLKTSITADSKGSQLKTENFYPGDFSGTAVYDLMVQKNMLDFVVRKDQYRASSLKNSAKVYFKQWANGGIYPEYIKEQVEANPEKTMLQINNYDDQGNMVSATSKTGIPECYLWGINKTLQTATVVNADVSDIAYASFEKYENSSWQYSGIPIANYNAPTGRKVYNLSSGVIQRTGLSPTATYVVSYWCNNGGQVVNGSTAVAGKTNGQFTYYEHVVVNPADGKISVSGSGSIDELRLYPKGAQMQTYTYDPLIGVSSQCDANNQIVYFEYDAFGRLLLVKDEKRQILKKVCYNYDGQTEDCSVQYYYNQAQSITLSPACVAGSTAAGQITYAVPANAYQSTVSVDAANQLALEDISSYGQQYANQTGICQQNVIVEREYELSSFYEDDYMYVEYIDVWLRFYSPTYVPLEILNNLNIQYRTSSTYSTYYQYTNISAPANTYEYYIGNFENIYSSSYTNQVVVDVMSWWW